jgi:dienelactone hydrolase
MPLATLVLILSLCLLAAPVFSAPPTSQPVRAGVENGWNPTFFEYDRTSPAEFVVATPTAQQVAFAGRPPELKAVAAPAADRQPSPVTVGPVDVLHVTFKNAAGAWVPALLATPAGKAGPFPLVVAIHGLRSNKAQVLAQVGPAMAKRGHAVLAVDMPLHGERPGDPNSIGDPKRMVQTYLAYHQAIVDVRRAIDVAERLPQVDAGRGVVLAGYSMGSWISSVAGPADERVRAMVLMVGGARALPPAVAGMPMAMAVDPRLAIAHFVGRPVLMLNGLHDVVVGRDLSDRLFGAAAEPKARKFYDCGHLLTADAYEDAAEWVAKLKS